ncbi:hypothetical protein [Streptomyces montanus]|uniref:hypothetical protein n=1 Tax=Streptomyces montanus TaxID=2580423 RepID=UPI0014863379|nr:hypothetical protein [Streptomyces montanus]
MIAIVISSRPTPGLQVPHGREPLEKRALPFVQGGPPPRRRHEALVAYATNGATSVDTP